MLAGPGTGKTTTIVEAICAQLADPVSPLAPDQVLALTFGRRAATELRERVTRRLGGGLAPTVATFHSFAYGLLRRTDSREEYLDPPRLMSGAEEDVRIRELLRGAVEDGAVDWPEELVGACRPSAWPPRCEPCWPGPASSGSRAATCGGSGRPPAASPGSRSASWPGRSRRSWSWRTSWTTASCCSAPSCAHTSRPSVRHCGASTGRSTSTSTRTPIRCRWRCCARSRPRRPPWSRWGTPTSPSTASAAPTSRASSTSPTGSAPPTGAPPRSSSWSGRGASGRASGRPPRPSSGRGSPDASRATSCSGTGTRAASRRPRSRRPRSRCTAMTTPAPRPRTSRASCGWPTSAVRCRGASSPCSCARATRSLPSSVPCTRPVCRSWSPPTRSRCGPSRPSPPCWRRCRSPPTPRRRPRHRWRTC